MPTDTHAFIPAQPGQSRSPCPALNALANHNYLPRSGQDITLRELVSALMHVYAFSLPFALFLSLVGIFACGAPLRMTLSLAALAAHNRIEHDASVVHADAPAPADTKTPVFAPTDPDPGLLAALVDRAHGGAGLSLTDLADARAGRDRGLWAREGRRLDVLHREIALGEMGLAWLVMRDMREAHAVGGGEGAVIPVQWVREWFGEERLPTGWVRPSQCVGLFTAMRATQRVKGVVNAVLAANE